MSLERKPFAIYAITKHGLEIGKKLFQGLEGSDLYVSQKFIHKAPEAAIALPLPFSPCLKELWQAYDAHIFIVSVGAVVRMIAPLLESKKTDPAVICVDDAQRFSISLLSGHVGRGNEYSEKVAALLQAMPVITTASDSMGTLTVDILGRDLGWRLDDIDRNVTRGCAAVVNEEKVALVQETGEPHFWPLDKPLPKGVSYFHEMPATDPETYSMYLWVTDRLPTPGEEAYWERAVVYRPRSLVVGIGCDRGASLALLRQGLMVLMKEAGLSLKAIKYLASIDLKADEPGLLALAEELGVPLMVEAGSVLDQVEGIENPSETVRRHVGCSSVAEAASLYFAGAKRLLVPKQKWTQPEEERNMTLAVSQIPFAKRSIH